MIVVSDTSPVVNLAGIGQLWLLPALFGDVILPPSVFDEIVVRGKGKPGEVEIATATWVQVRACTNASLLARFSHLDPGEAEAIALAVELNAHQLLIDEKAGRQAAVDENIQVIGILGILLRAKASGLIPNVLPHLNALVQFGFHVDAALIARVRTIAGE